MMTKGAAECNGRVFCLFRSVVGSEVGQKALEKKEEEATQQKAQARTQTGTL